MYFTFSFFTLRFTLRYCIISAMAKDTVKKKKTEKQKRLHIAVVTQMLTLATSGFGLVSALAWNNLIQTLVKEYIEPYLPGSGTVISLLLYALIVTLLAVVVTLQLSKLLRRLENDEE